MKGSDLGIVNSLINKKVKDTDVGNLANEIKDVQSQLDDNVQQINQVKNDYAKKTEVSDLTKDKATIVYVDNKVATLSSATPKFVNQISEMTDASKNYVLFDDIDGFIYTHNGTSFVQTSVKYQSKGIGNGTIKHKHLDVDMINSFAQGKNLLSVNDEDFAVGKYIDNFGSLGNSPDYQTTGYIEVSKGDNIIMSVNSIQTNMYRVCEYDINKNPIVDTLTTNTPMYQVKSDMAKYVRISAKVLVSNNVQIEKSIYVTEFEKFGYYSRLEKNYEEYLFDKHKEVKYENFADDLKYSIVKSKNLLNPTKLIHGMAINSIGGDMNSPDYQTTEYIKVSKGMKLNLSIDGVNYNCYRVFEYDINKQPISNSGETSVSTHIVSNENAEFVRFSAKQLKNEKAQIEIGDTVTSYVSFGYTVKGCEGNSITVNNNYVEQYIQNEIERIETISMSKTELLKFGFFTDTHIFSEDITKIKQCVVLDDFGYLDFIANGGDLIDGKGKDSSTGLSRKSDVLKQLKLISKEFSKSKTPIYSVRGNHENNFYDYATLGDNNLITKSEFSNILLNKYINKNYVKTDDKKGGYYYIDYDKCKIRVIFLNTSDILDDNNKALCNPVYSDIQQKQFNWFCNEALNFMEKGTERHDWGIVIISHASIVKVGTGQISYNDNFSDLNGNVYNFMGVINAFINGTTFSKTTCTGTDFQLVSNVDFTQQGKLEYICGICGHSHIDFVKFVPEINNKPQIYTCNLKCLQKGKGSGVGGSDLYPTTGSITDIVTPYRGEKDLYGDGTIQSELMDIFYIDRQSKIIKTTRYGAGQDRIINY